MAAVPLHYLREFVLGEEIPLLASRRCGLDPDIERPTAIEHMRKEASE